MDKASANNKKLESALDYSIKLLDSGVSIEECLRLYPNQRKELRELLEVAVSVKASYPGYPELRPSKLYAKIGREKFLAAIAGDVPATTHQINETKEPRSTGVFNIKSLFGRAYVTASAAAAALVILAGGLVYASSDSLPQSPLYGLKRAVEGVELALVFDNESKARLHYQLAQKRLAEAKSMANVGEKKTAVRIYKEAEDSLEQATKIAKSMPGGGQNKLRGEIETLDKTAKEQTNNVLSGVTSNKVAKTTEPPAPSSTDEKAASDNDAQASGEITPRSVIKQGRVNSPGTDTPSKRSLASMVPFEVDGVSVSDIYISPNADKVKDTVAITVSGASCDGYEVGLYKRATRVAVIAKKEAGRDLEFKWDGTDVDGNRIQDGRYTVKVENGIGQVAHAARTIIIDTKAPTIELIEPVNGISTENHTLRFVWSDVDDVEEYTLHIGSESDPGEVVTKSGLTANFYQLEKPLTSGNWRWRVVATDKAGNVSSSSYGKFRVEDIEKSLDNSDPLVIR
ncbi:MAG: DUF5667 domain-containing protein [Candidatus Aquicultor sp.]